MHRTAAEVVRRREMDDSREKWHGHQQMLADGLLSRQLDRGGSRWCGGAEDFRLICTPRRLR